jgi:hypothetical protein
VDGDEADLHEQRAGHDPRQRARRRGLEHARARLPAAREGRDHPGTCEVGERGHAQVAVEDGVEQEAAEEAGHGRHLEAAPEGQGHDEDGDQVGPAAERVQLRRHRDLQHHQHERAHERFRVVEH